MDLGSPTVRRLPEHQDGHGTCEKVCSSLDLPGCVLLVCDFAWSTKGDYAISTQPHQFIPFLHQCLHPFYSGLPVVFF